MTTTARSGLADPMTLAARRPRRRRGITVALVGADGAGKSTVSAMLQTFEGLPAPVRTIYMGVNLEASSLMLPTTRALLSVKRARKVGSVTGPSPVVRTRPVKDALRLVLWATEEWTRQAAATWYATRGSIVIFDRHFFADYYFANVHAEPEHQTHGTLPHLHTWMLRHLYPKPGLTLCLDAPVAVLSARKSEDTPAFLAQRRQQYLDLETIVPTYRRIDAAQPLDSVLADVVDAIHKHWAATR